MFQNTSFINKSNKNYENSIQNYLKTTQKRVQRLEFPVNHIGSSQVESATDHRGQSSADVRLDLGLGSVSRQLTDG